METGNTKLAVFFILSLCSHLVHHADGTCAPRTFRYLMAASGSPPPASSINKSSGAQPTLAPASAPSASKTPAQPKEPKSNIHSVVSHLPVTGSEINELPVSNTEVTKVCQATENPLLCLATVTPFLQGKFDPISILASEIKAIQNHTKVVMEHASQIASDPSTPEDVASALDYCKENYESVVSNLDDAVKGLEDHDTGLLNSMLSGVATDVSTCQDTFSEVSTSTSPMAAMDEITKNMAYNCLAILDYLKW